MNAVKKRPVFRGFVTFSISKPGLKLMTLVHRSPVNVTAYAPVTVLVPSKQ